MSFFFKKIFFYEIFTLLIISVQVGNCQKNGKSKTVSRTHNHCATDLSTPQFLIDAYGRFRNFTTVYVCLRLG